LITAAVVAHRFASAESRLIDDSQGRATPGNHEMSLTATKPNVQNNIAKGKKKESTARIESK